MDSALSIDPDLPKHAAQAYPDRHCSPPVDFLFQESLLYTSITLSRNVSARISLPGFRRLIWGQYITQIHNVCFLAGLLKFYTIILLEFLQQPCV